jgi:hypothetical protein
MKKLEKTSALKFNKFQISKIKNPIAIVGGNGTNQGDITTSNDTQYNGG